MVVHLRLATLDDAKWEYFWRHGSADAAWKQWDAPYFHSDAAPAEFETFAADYRADSHDRMIIALDGEPVGVVTRYETAPAGGGWWELGIVIYDPAYWGRGIGKDALAQWTRRIFDDTNAHLITLTTWSGNERMIRSAEAVGFTECGRVPEARAWNGKRWDSVRMALLRRHATGLSSS